MRFRKQLVLPPIIAVLAASPAVWAQPSPAGGEFRVNAYTSGVQRLGSVAAVPTGGFVVVWTSGAADGSGQGVFARRYDPAGQGGPEFRVNTYTTGDQVSPSVAADRRGNFVVVWTGPDGSGGGVFGQRFDAAGAALGGEFRVNAVTTGPQSAAGVASDDAGNFVVAWTGSAAVLQRYDSSGTPRGAPLQFADRSSAGVASDATGNFVALLEGCPGPGMWRRICARVFDRSGAPRGGEFRLTQHADTWDVETHGGAAWDTHGGFVVAWNLGYYHPPAAPPAVAGTSSGTFWRRFDGSGAPRGAPFEVSPAPGYPSIASGAAGDFIVAWGFGDVFAQRYEASGQARGAPFRVNSYTPSYQYFASLAADPAGNVVVAWDSQLQDGSQTGVFGQRFGGILPAALSVDTVATGGANGNRVLEQGESVDVRPAWRNANGAALAFNGAGLAFTGPPAGMSYDLLDGAATYGTVAHGATAQCSDCYGVAVTQAESRPSTHWDATFTERLTPDALGQTMPWPLHIGDSFGDVPRSSPFYRSVETLLHRGVTAGCATAAYCPGSPVTRAQMSAFVLLARHGAAFVAPACSPPNLFADVPETSVFCDVVEELARRGVVGGCGGGNYCPDASVSREQMPVFVLRLLDPALVPPACTTPMFADVPASSPFCRWIEELARRGVVGGCGGGRYCPAAAVTRDQMAVFLVGTYGLTLYGP
jgi:S-layer family protein